MPKVHTVRLRVEAMNPSRQQYKPYNFMMAPENLYVEIPVATADIIDNGPDGMVLTLDGFAALLNSIATALDDMHSIAIMDARKKGQLL